MFNFNSTDMQRKNPEILVIGAGGIGGITAVQMATAGYHVEVADCQPGLAQVIEGRGIEVINGGYSRLRKMKAWSDIAEVESRKDVILIATKANALESVARAIIPIIKENTVIISLQNGMCEEYLADRFGNEKVIGCVVGWGATVIKPGVVEKTSEGHFMIGRIGEARPNHYDFVKKILSAVAPVSETDNIFGCLYSKLIINSCITTLGAISGLTLGTMLTKWRVRKIFIDVIRESVTVARARHLHIDKYAGKIDFYFFADHRGWLAVIIQHLIILLVGIKYWRLKSSSLQSLQTGHKTEIDYLNGYIARKASESNLDVPLNIKLIKMVKEIESGIRKISYQNFDLLRYKEYSY
jgi:2-dehydropantoate 2-reductase